MGKSIKGCEGEIELEFKTPLPKDQKWLLPLLLLYLPGCEEGDG